MEAKVGKHQPQDYEPEGWKADDESLAGLERLPTVTISDPNVQEQCRVLDLLGKINYRILSGNRVYVEVGGIVYRTLYGGYWRSVFTGIEHYLLRCEQVSGSAWSGNNASAVDLPIAYSKEGWTASGHSLSFILNRDPTDTPSGFMDRLRRTGTNAKQRISFRNIDMFCA